MRAKIIEGMKSIEAVIEVMEVEGEEEVPTKRDLHVLCAGSTGIQ